MQKQFIILLFLFWTPLASSQYLTYGQSPAANTIQIQTNRNVEFLGFVYFLGYEGPQLENNYSYLKGRSIKKRDWYGYGLSLYQHYKSYENSKHLAVVMGVAERIWLDYLINLLLQLDDFPNASLVDSISENQYRRFSTTNDPQEAKKNVTQFIDAMNQLYQEVHFDTYFQKSYQLYDKALSQVRQGLPGKEFLPAMEHFYGKRFDQYTLVPSLTIPTGMGFGIKYTRADKTNTFNVFGPLGLQQFSDESRLNMGFDDQKHLLELSTHEFGHSFVNPIVFSLSEELIAQTQPLFEPIKEEMANQGYTNWKACLCEHFVRAGEIIIAQNLRHRSDAARLKSHYINDRHFIYLPIILSELNSYNKKRASSYDYAVKKAMQALQQFVNGSPYKQLGQSIHDNGRTMHIRIKGVRFNGEKLYYDRSYPVMTLSAQQRDSLKNHILDSLGIKAAPVVAKAGLSSTEPISQEVLFLCDHCGQKGYLEVHGTRFLSTQKIDARRDKAHRFPIHLWLSVGDYKFIYYPKRSKPIQSIFRVETGQQTIVQIN